MIVIAFDFGIKNIGVAVGQNITYTAQRLSSIKIKNNKINFKKIKQLFLEWQPNSIIVGLPLNMDGTKQNITQQVEKFSKKISLHFKIPIYFHDERLTTIEAKSILFKTNGAKSLKKEIIDSTSAVLILESWLKENISP